MAKTPKSDKPRQPRAKKTKPDVPGASGVAGIGDNSKLSADEERALFLTHRTTWTGWRAKVAALEEIERDVKAALKSDGFTVKQFQIADALLTVKGEKKVKEEVNDRLKVARWLGLPMGAQLDLFAEPDRTPAVDSAFDAGKMDSMENKPCKPPYSPETEQYRQYIAGWQNDQARLAKGFSATEDGFESESGERVSREEWNRRMKALSETDIGQKPAN